MNCTSCHLVATLSTIILWVFTYHHWTKVPLFYWKLICLTVSDMTWPVDCRLQFVTVFELSFVFNCPHHLSPPLPWTSRDHFKRKVTFFNGFSCFSSSKLNKIQEFLLWNMRPYAKGGTYACAWLYSACFLHSLFLSSIYGCEEVQAVATVSNPC